MRYDEENQRFRSSLDSGSLIPEPILFASEEFFMMFMMDRVIVF